MKKTSNSSISSLTLFPLLRYLESTLHSKERGLTGTRSDLAVKDFFVSVFHQLEKLKRLRRNTLLHLTYHYQARSSGSMELTDNAMLSLIRIAIILHIGLVLSAQAPNGEDLTLPLTQQLETSLRTFYEEERNAQLAAYNTKTAGNWKDLLPSVGVTYTLSNQPRPTLSWSPISILNRQDAKRKEVLSRQSMVRTYDVFISDRLFKLHQLISTYHIDLDALQAKSAALELDELLFDIVEERYNENLIKPTEYLREQKKILLSREIVASYKQQLLKQRAEIIYTAKYTNSSSIEDSRKRTSDH